jgi:hypothetical protein
MLFLPATTAPDPVFTPGNALATLLTVESLLFAALLGAVALSSAPAFAVSPQAAARTLAVGVAGVLTGVAAGAGFAWARIFVVGAWPSRVDELVPAMCIALGIVAQPVIAWTVVRLLHRRGTRDG